MCACVYVCVHVYICIFIRWHASAGGMTRRRPHRGSDRSGSTAARGGFGFLSFLSRGRAVCVPRVYVCVCVCVCVCMYVYICTYIYIYVYVYVYIYSAGGTPRRRPRRGSDRSGSTAAMGGIGSDDDDKFTSTKHITLLESWPGSLLAPCVCVCVCVYYICIYVYIFVYVYMYICIYIYMY